MTDTAKKAIEEMAKDICRHYEEGDLCRAYNEAVECNCDCWYGTYLAPKLYDAGYRKQSEGVWILEREPNGNPYCFHCSVCGVDMIKIASKFCPNCGARMKGA